MAFDLQPQPLLKPSRNLDPVESTRRHLPAVEIFVGDAAPASVIASGDVEHHRMGMKIRIPGAAVAMLKQRPE